uniref:Subtilisin-like protease SBT1.5 n=2 Tax=Elaeis guineensis var. tenera TaxID=51953 RepID=A0A6I9RA03_ELAGV|nr:subtilisin-like protease SBT1.5 [Elaeis guineensis]
MQKPIFFLFVASLLSLSTPTLLLVHGQLLPIVDDHGANATTMRTYIVHVQKPKGTKFLGFRDRVAWYKSFLPNTTLDSGEPRLIYAYRHVISGFAAMLTPKEVQVMETMEGFVQAYPEMEHVAQTTSSPDFLGLSRWDGLWVDTFYGQGQIIGVIDTGVKPTHPSFGERGNMPPPPPKWRGSCYWGPPICNNKLIGAMAFRRRLNPNPRDRDGHGTHTASTAAGRFVDDAEVLGQARGTASGTAPQAHLAIYKVLFNRPGRPSTGTDSDILKGIDQAIRDHVDVLSMSLGATNISLYKSSIAMASYAAITKGIFPCAAAANEGPFNSLIGNDAPWILTVGASTMDRRIRAIVKLGNGMEFYGESAYQPSPSNSTQLPLVHPGALGTTDAFFCLNGSLDSFNVSGKIVLCARGNIDDVEKGKIVKAAGGAGMILSNLYFMGNTTFADPHVLPVAHVSDADAQQIVDYVETTQNATAAITFNGTQFGVHPTPAVAYFSSRGPSLRNGNIIKPDVIAPGVNILAAWPFEVGQNRTNSSRTFKFVSGTSMATPHVSGVVALLRNNHPNWSVAAIKSAIMTTAYTKDRDGNPITDQYNGTASVFAMGSGHVDPVAANDPGLIYDIRPHDYIRYLCGSGFTDRQVTAIVRGAVNCSQVRAISAEQLNYPSIAVYLSLNSTTKTIKRTVTNVGDANTVYRVQFEEPEGVRVDVSPNTLRFSQVDEKKSYNVTLTPMGGTTPVAGQVSEGHLAWASGKYYVRSPIAVTFT